MRPFKAVSALVVGIGGAGSAYDTDADAFFTRAGITDSTQKSATNQLVLDLKSAGIWTKMDILYPFVGGTESTHKYNLKANANHLTSLATGFITHSSGGVQSDGTSGHVMSGSYVIATDNSASLTIYCRTATATSASHGALCSFYDGVDEFGIYPRYSDNNTYWTVSSGATGIGAATSDARGCYAVSRTASNSCKAFKNGTQVGATSTVAPNPNTGVLVICGTNSGTPNNQQCAFTAAGAGLTDTEVSSFYTAIQAYQTTLGRNV